MEQLGTTFRHSWRDHTLTTKEGGEYLIWCKFLPDDGKMVIYLSTKHIANFVEFERAWVSKFEDLLNQSGRTKGKGKGKASLSTAMEIDNATMPFNATSHAKTAKFPFAISFMPVNDSANHWEVWRELWQNAVAHAQAPYKCKKIDPIL